MSSLVEKTKENWFWAESLSENSNSQQITVIAGIEYSEPNFIKLDPSMTEEEFTEAIKAHKAFGENIAIDWLPSKDLIAPYDTKYSDETKDNYLFVQTLTSSKPDEHLKDVYEKAVGSKWQGSALSNIMSELKMERVSNGEGFKDSLEQKNVEELPKLAGWSVLEWTAEATSDEEGKEFILDKVEWVKDVDVTITIEGTVKDVKINVSVISILSWVPYKKPKSADTN